MNALFSRRAFAGLLSDNVAGVVHVDQDVGFAGEEPGFGARLDLPGGARPDVLLFAETPSRAIVTTRDDLRMAELARRHGVRWARVGTVGGDRLVLSSGGAARVDLPVADLRDGPRRCGLRILLVYRCTAGHQQSDQDPHRARHT